VEPVLLCHRVRSPGNSDQPPATLKNIDSWMSDHRAIDVIIDISISRSAARYCKIASRAILIGHFDSVVLDKS
jgi:hypothetical protein